MKLARETLCSDEFLLFQPLLSLRIFFACERLQPEVILLFHLHPVTSVSWRVCIEAEGWWLSFDR